MPTLIIETIPEVPANRNWQLNYTINPGGSMDLVRDNATGTEGTGIGVVQCAKGTAASPPFYFWTLARSILWFDLSAYPTPPGVVQSVKIRLMKATIGVYYGADWANDSLYALDDEGKVPTQADLTSDDYGKWKSNNTVLGTMAGVDYGGADAGGYYIYITLNSAGIAHLNWGGLTAFVLRTAKDVNNLQTPLETTGEAMYGYDGPTHADPPALVIEHSGQPYSEFKGLFCRGDEIQAVFADGRGYRSPDFGANWYAMEGEPITTRDVGFDILNEEESFLGASGQLYPFLSAAGEIFTYAAGATVSGEVTRIDVDWDSKIAVVGTSEKLYKTPDFGTTVYEYLDKPVTDVALGGNEVALYEDPPTSGYILSVNGDCDIYYKSGFYGWRGQPDQPTGSYWLNVRYRNTEWYPNTWGYFAGTFLWNDMNLVTIQATFTMENLPTSGYAICSSRGIAEVRVLNYCGRSAYPYGHMQYDVKTHGVHYVTDEDSLPASKIDLRAAGMTKNPNTGLGWTADEVDAMCAGCYAGDVASFGTAALDQVLVEVYPEGDGVDIVGATPIPAPADGYVRKVQIYLYTECTNIKVATFFNVSGNNYSTRSWQALTGTYSAGFHTLSVNLECSTGDLIGIFSDGMIEADATWNALNIGAWKAVAGGDKIPCTNEEFENAKTQLNDMLISIRGIIYH